MERFQTTEVNTDGLFDYNPTLFFSGIALMVFSPIIFCIPCMCRSCFQKCKCASCCKSGTALQSANQPAGDKVRNRFHHHYSIDSETGDLQPANNDTGNNEFISTVELLFNCSETDKWPSFKNFSLTRFLAIEILMADWREYKLDLSYWLLKIFCVKSWLSRP